jgi:hypothetical protein
MRKDTKGPRHDQNKGQNQEKRKADAISDNKGASHSRWEPYKLQQDHPLRRNVPGMQSHIRF